METFSALLAFCAGNSPITGEFPTQRLVTRSFDVCLDLGLNQQLRRRWLWTPWRSLWHHCNDVHFCDSSPVHFTLVLGDHFIGSWFQSNSLNSLYPNDAIWHNKSVSILAQVMIQCSKPMCLTAPNHYLEPCGLLICEVLLYSPDNYFAENV